jgi:CRISPR-associated endonuclease Cas1 subtype II
MKISTKSKTKLNQSAWKTIYIESPGKISLQLNHLIIENDVETIDYPLIDIDLIIITNNQTIITLPIVVYCMENHIHILIQSNKHLPVGTITPTVSHHDSRDKLIEQMNWKQNQLDWFWRQIVINKITNQLEVLKKLNLHPNLKFHHKIDLVDEGDTKNIEGQFAKMYFPLMFAKTFKRFQDDPINHGLNYGYSIIHSLIQRHLTILGFHTQLGLHHKSKTNPYNLAYDLIEPFRPIVDFIIANKFKDQFNKNMIADLFNYQIKVEGKIYEFKDGIYYYINKLMNYLNSGELTYAKIEI